jgi:hypothetical protein
MDLYPAERVHRQQRSRSDASMSCLFPDRYSGVATKWGGVRVTVTARCSTDRPHTPRSLSQLPMIGRHPARLGSCPDCQVSSISQTAIAAGQRPSSCQWLEADTYYFAQPYMLDFSLKHQTHVDDMTCIRPVKRVRKSNNFLNSQNQ